MRVTIVHPDLGIGGAERLIIDAALAIKKNGHSVTIVTNQYDEAHAFAECSQLEIIPSFSWLPSSVLGSCRAACAYLRMCLAAVYVSLFMTQDVILCDQISAALFVFHFFRVFGLLRSRLIFYCHFPDLLLTHRATRAKALYRRVIDCLEERSIILADAILVNSNFTASIVRKTFHSLGGRQLHVVYPSLNTDNFDRTEGFMPDNIQKKNIGSRDHMFVSLNRFEKKKNIQLAIDAFVEMSRRLRPSDYARCHLVVAGGYDKRNHENLTLYRELRDYALECGISSKQHTFLQSPSDGEKMWLLRNARAILYTPANEHFGIVPVESMYCGTPVVAANSGGPLESVDHDKTGFLVEPCADSFAQCMITLVQDEKKRTWMSREGPLRVRRLFAFDAFAHSLQHIVCGSPRAEEERVCKCRLEGCKWHAEGEDEKRK